MTPTEIRELATGMPLLVPAFDPHGTYKAASEQAAKALNAMSDLVEAADAARIDSRKQFLLWAALRNVEEL